MFRDEREIIQAIAGLLARAAALEGTIAALAVRVKTLEDRAGGVDTTVHSKLDLLLHQQTLLLQQGGSIMATQQQAEQLLDEINEATSAMAVQLVAIGPKLDEVDLDIDALLTRPAGEPISDQLKARFELHRDALRGVRSTLDTTADRLTATASKYDSTPPVTEPPVEQPPVEEPPAPVV